MYVVECAGRRRVVHAGKQYQTGQRSSGTNRSEVHTHSRLPIKSNGQVRCAASVSCCNQDKLFVRIRLVVRNETMFTNTSPTTMSISVSIWPFSASSCCLQDPPFVGNRIPGRIQDAILAKLLNFIPSCLGGYWWGLTVFFKRLSLVRLRRSGFWKSISFLVWF